MANLRIISLIASATEIVSALGYEKDLVGRSHECDYPVTVKRLPVCTSPKFNVEGSSRLIDERVKTVVSDSLSVYSVDTELLDQLRPTHIITQSQCEVCAVSLKDVERAVCEITSSNPTIVSLEPNSLSDVWNDIRRVGNAVGDSDGAKKLIDKLKERMKNIAEKTGSLKTRPRVAGIEWIDPLMATGNWMPELIEMAGGVNLFGENGKHSPWMTWNDLEEQDPDVILVTPCGFDLARTLEELTSLTRRPEWPRLKAVRSGRVFVADGNQYFNRPGPRLVESLEILAEMFNPESFDFGHKKSGHWTVSESD